MNLKIQRKPSGKIPNPELNQVGQSPKPKLTYQEVHRQFMNRLTPNNFDNQILTHQNKIAVQINELAQIVNIEQYNNQLLEGGEFCVLEPSGKRPQIRWDIQTNTMKEAEKKCSELLGFDVVDINWNINLGGIQVLNNYYLQTIPDSQGGGVVIRTSPNILELPYGEIRWHYKGHPKTEQPNDSNSWKPHFNIELQGIKTKFGNSKLKTHITYQD